MEGERHEAEARAPAGGSSADRAIGREARLTIREATSDDAAAMLQVAADIDHETDGRLYPCKLAMSFDGPPGAALRALQQRGDGTYFIAMSDDAVIGFVALAAGLSQRNRGAMCLPQIGVAAPYRGRGIGRRLLEAAEASGKARLGYRVELTIPERNVAMLRLLRTAGYVEEGRIAAAWLGDDGWETDVWMAHHIVDRTEPRWEPTRVDGGQRQSASDRIVFRRPRPKDAAAMWKWEHRLLSESTIHIKQAHEISEVPAIARQLKAVGAASRQFALAAFRETGDATEMLGSVYAKPNYGARDKEMFLRLNVLPDYAGLGIGQRLYAEMETWASGLGTRRLSTWVQGHNARGLRFGARNGFVLEVTSRDYALIDGRLSDRVLLGKVFD